MKTFVSDLSQKEFPISEKISGNIIRDAVRNLILHDYPDFKTQNFLAISELNYYREKYISDYLIRELGELSDAEKEVIETITDKSIISENLAEDQDEDITFGQRIADKVADFGGSWKFIIIFLVVIILWIALNIYWLKNKGFDPYPFILLNLILSCLAALQAPVIMMSQNRQEDRDRERAKKDYLINLKSELEIRTLHEKIDHLIIHQQKDILEIQQYQSEMMNEILKKIGPSNE